MGGGPAKHLKLKAFTLAEVLITLGIIGVVAAMTLPALINNKQNKELEVLLIKNYSILQQALLTIYNEEGQPITAKNYNREQVGSLLRKNIKDLSYCNNCGAAFEDNGNNSSVYTINGYRTLHGTKLHANYFDDLILEFKDGRRLFIERPTQSSTYDEFDNFWMTIDINGYKKKPNRLGIDFFTFMVMPNGKLLPMGSEETRFSEEEYCSVNSTSNINGIGCTYKALSEKDYFKNLPK